MSNIEQRLARLEASQRRWRMAALTCGLLLMCGVSMGAKANSQARKVKDLVRMHELQIVDEENRPVVRLWVNDRGDGVVSVNNNRGTQVSLMGANFRGDGLVNVANNDGQWVGAMAASDRGDGIIETFHEDGEVATIAGCTPRGDGMFKAVDR